MFLLYGCTRSKQAQTLYAFAGNMARGIGFAFRQTLVQYMYTTNVCYTYYLVALYDFSSFGGRLARRSAAVYFLLLFFFFIHLLLLLFIAIARDGAFMSASICVHANSLYRRLLCFFFAVWRAYIINRRVSGICARSVCGVNLETSIFRCCYLLRSCLSIVQLAVC